VTAHGLFRQNLKVDAGNRQGFRRRFNSLPLTSDTAWCVCTVRDARNAAKAIMAMLCNGPSLDLDKARFSSPVRLSEPTLKIKEAHSLATAKLRTGQPALLIQSDNSCLLLRAKTPTRPPCHFILNFHARDYPKSRRPSPSWPSLRGYKQKVPCRVIHLERNFGHQAAIMARTDSTGEADATILREADLRDSPEAIPVFLEKWHAGLR
jgi:hypothetical protein